MKQLTIPFALKKRYNPLLNHFKAYSLLDVQIFKNCLSQGLVTYYTQVT